MESSTVQRRLAAILAADVVGYSRLMSIDEMGTLNALKAHRRELIDPAIAAHHGRMVKTTGDGALVEFASVVDAVGCAIVIQRAMIGRNPGKSRRTKRVPHQHQRRRHHHRWRRHPWRRRGISPPAWKPPEPAARASRACKRPDHVQTLAFADRGEQMVRTSRGRRRLRSRSQDIGELPEPELVPAAVVSRADAGTADSSAL